MNYFRLQSCGRSSNQPHRALAVVIHYLHSILSSPESAMVILVLVVPELDPCASMRFTKSSPWKKMKLVCVRNESTWRYPTKHSLSISLLPPTLFQTRHAFHQARAFWRWWWRTGIHSKERKLCNIVRIPYNHELNSLDQKDLSRYLDRHLPWREGRDPRVWE